MSENIYGIATRYANLLSLAVDDSMSDKEFADSVHDAIDCVEGELEAKCANGVGFLHFLDDKIAAAEAQEKRIKAYKQFLQNRQEVVKKAFIDGLNRIEKSEVITDNGVMKIRKNPPKVVIDCADMIPEKYLGKTITYKPLLMTIKEALKKGENVPGAHLEQGENLKY